MNKYLYIFGYQTPEEAARKNPPADQHSLAVFIEALSEEEALVWGREISEEFTRRLFHDRQASWKAMHLTDCIINEGCLESPSEQGRHIPVVPCGKYPDFAAFKR